MAQIALVSDQHDDDIGIGVVPQLLQPSRDVLVCLVFANIIDEEGPHGASIVGRGDSAVPFLTGSIPDLGLDGLGVNLDGAGGELYTDGRFRVEVEFIAGKSAQEVGLSDAGVTNQYNCRQTRSAGAFHGGGGGMQG